MEKAAEPQTKGEPVMEKGTTYVGMDVHKSESVVALSSAGLSRPLVSRVPTERRSIESLGRRWVADSGPGRVVCAYEAGACGYEVQRWLQGVGVECQVIAPSLIPVKPGQRIKTDRRDALQLLECLQAGSLTEVHPPSPEQEAGRDLSRAHDDVRTDLLRAHHRLSKFLLRRGRVFREGKAWTQKHEIWLNAQRFEFRADQVVYAEYRLAVEQALARKKALAAELEALSQTEPYREPVGWLRCLRGIDTLTAIAIVTELHGVARFATARRLMGFVGLVPSEDSSGPRVRRGGLTKAGNRHLRRLFVEAAWHARHRPTVSAALRARQKGQPAEILAIADRAQRRLYEKYHRLVGHRLKPPTLAVAAVARELVGFVWAALVQHPARQAQSPGA